MKPKYIDDLIDAVFADFMEEERRNIHVEFRRLAWPPYTSAHAYLPELFYEEKARLYTGDTFNEITGAAIALAKLRESILSSRSKKLSLKIPWVPEFEEKWYTAELRNDRYEIVEHKGFNTNSPANMVDLEQGAIFKTERAARKWIRQKETEGRRKYNAWKRYRYQERTL